MNKWLSLILGLILLVVSISIFGLNNGFNEATIIVFKGILLWGIFFVGLALIILGISELKN